MKNCNKVCKLMSLVYFGILGLFIFMAILPFLLLFSAISLVIPSAMNIYYAIFQTAVSFYLFVSPLKFKIKETKILDQYANENYMVVANHRSHLDMFLFLATVHKVRAVANAKLFKVPLLGFAMSLSGHFPVERGSVKKYKKTIRRIHEAFDASHVVLFFPEMTRCMQGDEGIQKFRLTAFQLARENNIKIIPAVVSGTDHIWPKKKLEANFNEKVSLKFLDAVDPSQFVTSIDLSNHIHDLMEETLVEISK